MLVLRGVTITSDDFCSDAVLGKVKVFVGKKFRLGRESCDNLGGSMH